MEKKNKNGPAQNCTKKRNEESNGGKRRRLLSSPQNLILFEVF